MVVPKLWLELQVVYLDHIDKGTLPLDNLRTFILDEADEMLRMGFIEDIETIMAKFPKKKQMACFQPLCLIVYVK